MSEFIKSEKRNYGFKDLTGQKVFDLEVLKFLGRKNRQSYWLCRCVCGKEIPIRAQFITARRQKSCGCIRERSIRDYSDITTHGLSRHPLYMTWWHMMSRCYDSKNPAYENYGKRGIKVCNRWHDLKNFIEDIGERVIDMSRDRIDNSGDYTFSNTRWAASKTQVRNRRNTKTFIVDGQEVHSADLADRLGIQYKTLMARIYKGWSIEEILNYGETRYRDSVKDRPNSGRFKSKE